MSYRILTPVKPTVWVEAQVQTRHGSRVDYLVKVKAQFKKKSAAQDVEIEVPCPIDADTPKFKVCMAVSDTKLLEVDSNVMIACSGDGRICTG